MQGWETLFSQEEEKTYYQTLMAFVDQEYQTETIYPARENLFKIFETVAYDQVKVVILGQDPYHQLGQAMGLSFSVPANVKLPPSLHNMYKELHQDLGIENHSGDLTPWAKQGVFLLNTVLTVRASKPLSHQKKGWETFTDEVIRYLSLRKDPIIFILWGSNAQQKQTLIADHHFIIKSAHPSPLSAYRGFFGSHPYSQTNDYLAKLGKTIIDWRITQ